jgi:hypothetical protein
MAVDTVAKKMSEASAKTTPPKKGEKFRCQQCGMAIEVTNACSCKDGSGVHFQCCNQEMAKV